MRSTSARAWSGSEASTSRSSEPPDPRFVDLEAEVPERVLDRLALWVEDPGLRPDEHGRLHTRTVVGSAAYSSNEHARDLLERLDVAGARAGDHVVGKPGPGRSLVPAERLRVVADELLVERGLRAAGLVLVGRPEARGVRREDLVSEDDRPVVGEPELELRVGDDDPRSSSGLGGGRVELDRDPLQLGEALVADERGRLLRGQRSRRGPSAAFVVGVKIGSGSRSDSLRPSGSAMSADLAASRGSSFQPEPDR